MNVPEQLIMTINYGLNTQWKIKDPSLSTTETFKNQKQPPEVFSEKKCSQKFRKIHRPEACNFIKKETHAQMFSCEFCEIFKNTFFTEQPWTTASVLVRFVE